MTHAQAGGGAAPWGGGKTRPVCPASEWRVRCVSSFFCHWNRLAGFLILLNTRQRAIPMEALTHAHRQRKERRENDRCSPKNQRKKEKSKTHALAGGAPPFFSTRASKRPAVLRISATHTNTIQHHSTAPRTRSTRRPRARRPGQRRPPPPSSTPPCRRRPPCPTAAGVAARRRAG